MKNNVIKFPITYLERKKNEMGKGYVPCIVSSRWLQFPSKAGRKLSIGEPIEVSVMTIGADEKRI